jgi:hypothetical protein
MSRKKIPALTQKQVMSESNSRCAFCSESDVATIILHHIDGDPSNGAAENLIAVCASCHLKISRGIISHADVVTKKRELFWKAKNQRSAQEAAVNVTIHGSSFTGDIAQNMTKVTFRHVSPPKTTHPPGSLGANLPMKGYIDYLIARYFQYRKADTSYGRRTPFSYAVMHKNIQSKFGAHTFFLPEAKFGSLAAYLKQCIDGTIQGKANQARGLLNYHSFQEHCLEHGFDVAAD